MRRFNKIMVTTIISLLLMFPCLKSFAEEEWIEYIEQPRATSDNPINLGEFTYATENDLGSIAKYAVFANTYEKSMHIEGTIATKVLNINSTDGIGPQSTIEQYLDENGENFVYFENIGNPEGLVDLSFNPTKSDAWIMPNNILFVIGYRNNQDDDYTYLGNEQDGNAMFVYAEKVGAEYVPTEYKTEVINNVFDKTKADEFRHVEETTYQIDFDEAFEKLSKYSDAKYKKTTEDVSTTVSSNEQAIEIVCKKGVCNIVNLTTEELGPNQYGNCKEIKVLCYDEDGTTATGDFALIINVKDENGNELTSGDIVLNGKTTVNGNMDAYGPCGGKIMWNFGPEYDGKVRFEQTTIGMILAPKAAVEIAFTHNGSVWADTIENLSGAEIHQNKFIEYAIEESSNEEEESGDEEEEESGNEEEESGNEEEEAGNEEEESGDEEEESGNEEEESGNEEEEAGNEEEEAGNEEEEAGNEEEAGDKKDPEENDEVTIEDPSEKENDKVINNQTESKDKDEAPKDDKVSTGAVKTEDSIYVYLYSIFAVTIIAIICESRKYSK